MKDVQDLTDDQDRAADVFRALGNPARIRIVVELSRRNACATDLVEVLPLAPSTVSRHLRVLREAGLIRGTIEDDLCYCLDEKTVRWLAAFCNDICCPPGLDGDGGCAAGDASDSERCC